MLHLTNGAIVETGNVNNYADTKTKTLAYQNNLQNSGYSGGFQDGQAVGQVSSCLQWGYQWPYQTHWYSYPVYVCSDKTAKAIKILKKLQAEKVIDVKAVPRFIELVEQISAIL